MHIRRKVMSIIVTLDMYSGLPNPSWEITDDEANKLNEILTKKRTQSTVTPPSITGRLGYRGLIISSSTDNVVSSPLRVFDGILETPNIDTSNFIDHDSEVETFLLETAGTALRPDECQYIQQEIQKNVNGGIANSLSGFNLMAIPPYDAGKWNNNPTVLRNNNCYNYGNDKITNTFAQPGRGSGQEAPYPPSCAGTTGAAVRDGLISISNPDMTPAEGHIVALVVSTTPGFLDYHWYRRDSNNMWSHKPGQTVVRNTDNSGNLISDPRTCDRGLYNNFCGFFNAIPSRTTIR
jgi:hypothetical protein